MTARSNSCFIISSNSLPRMVVNGVHSIASIGISMNIILLLNSDDIRSIINGVSTSIPPIIVISLSNISNFSLISLLSMSLLIFSTFIISTVL